MLPSQHILLVPPCSSSDGMEPAMTSSAASKTTPYLAAALVLVPGLYALSLYSYLVFHTAIELFSVLTAFLVFALVWHSRATHDDHYLLFIGIALLSAGALDLLHLFAYKGMGIFPPDDGNLATQFWIAFRFVFSLSFLAGMQVIGKKLRVGRTLLLYCAVVYGLTTAILLGWFPACFASSTGLTRFKIISEYGIGLTFLFTLVLLVRRRRSFDPVVFRFIALSLLLSIAAEVSFTDYVSVYGFANMLGHFFLLASVASIYRAIVFTAVVEPSRLLYNNLRRREEELRESESQFRTLADSIPNLAWWANSDGYITWYNRRWYDYTGTTPEQMAGWGWQSVHDPATLPRVMERWTNSLKTGQPFDMEFPLRGADGVFRSFLTRVMPVKDASGAVVRWFGTNTDVSERKRAEEALRLSEEKFALAFANNPAAVALTRLEDGMFLEVNDTWVALTGYGRDEAIGHSARTMSIWPQPEAASRFVQELKDKGSLRGWEQEFRKKSGEHYFAQLSAQLLTIRGETHILSTLVDLSERKRAEQALRRAHDELELRVRERTAALVRTNELLEQGAGERLEIEGRTQLINELLKLYPQKFSRKEYLDAAVVLIRDWSGCAHAGIRMLREDGSIPYESCVAFSPEFLQSENMLSLLTDQCACIRVIAETPDQQDLPSMTANGSFYTNDSTAFVAGLSPSEQGRFRGVCVRTGYRSIAVVPIRYRGKVYGAIHLADERTDMLPARTVELFEQLALILGEAVFRFSVEEDLKRQSEELVRMNEQLRNLTAHVDAVREAERTTIAREIHDELGQVLTAIKMDVSWLGKRLPRDKTPLVEKADQTLQSIDAAIQSVKRISAELRPGVLDDIGLSAAIEWACTEFAKRTKARCTVSVVPENLTVDRMRSTALFRILQESLTNIIRHAKATRVTVSLQQRDRSIVLTVSDNGKGIAPERISSPHAFGLIGMRERVQFLHGTIAFKGFPNRGTTVSVTLPIDSERGQTGAPAHGAGAEQDGDGRGEATER